MFNVVFGWEICCNKNLKVVTELLELTFGKESMQRRENVKWVLVVRAGCCRQGRRFLWIVVEEPERSEQIVDDYLESNHLLLCEACWRITNCWWGPQNETGILILPGSFQMKLETRGNTKPKSHDGLKASLIAFLSPITPKDNNQTVETSLTSFSNAFWILPWF